MRQTCQYSVTQTFTSTSESAQQQLIFNNDYDFVVQKLMHYATATDYTVQMVQGHMLYQGSPVYAPALFGTIQYPAEIERPGTNSPFVLKRGSNVYFNMVNGSTASNTVQMVLEGYHTDEVVSPDKQWFQYPIKTFTFTGTSEQQYGTLQNTSGFDFIIEKFLAYATTDDYYVKITDANIWWIQNLNHSTTCFGTAQRPNVLRQPIVFPAGGSLTAQVVNGATASNTVQLVLEGYLIRPRG